MRKVNIFLILLIMFSVIRISVYNHLEALSFIPTNNTIDVNSVTDEQIKEKKSSSSSITNPPLLIDYDTDLSTFKPEPNIAASEVALAVAMNSKVVGYDKTSSGHKLYSIEYTDLFPASINSESMGDSEITYDRVNKRFFLSAMSFNFTTNDGYFLLAASKNQDPRNVNDWCVYYSDSSKFGSTEENFFADRLQMSLDPINGYIHLTSGMFQNGDFKYMKFRSLNYSQFMSNCNNQNGIEAIDRKGIQTTTNEKFYTLIPAQRYDDGPPILLSMPVYITQTKPITYIDVLTFDGGMSTFYTRRTLDLSPSFLPAGHFINQPTPPQLIVQWAIMIQAEVRGNTIWFSHEAGFGGNRGIRYYKLELNPNPDILTIISRSSNGADFFLGSITTNDLGDALIIFNASSQDPVTGFISIRYAEFSTASSLVTAGDGVYAPDPSRQVWGDYAMSSPDPNGSDIWLVHIVARKDANQVVNPTVHISSTKAPLPQSVYLPLITH